MNLSIEETRYIKGIAILTIVLGHLGLLYKGGGIGVHLFLFVSGYGCIKSYHKQGLNNYWRRKFRRIYIPYLILSLIKYPSSTLFGGVKGFLISVIGLDLGINIEMWYISYVFMWYLIFYISVYVLNRYMHSEAFIGTTMTFFSIILFFLLQNEGYMIWHSGAGADLYTFAFPIGVLCGRLPDIVEKKKFRIVNQIFFVFSSSLFFKFYGYCETYYTSYMYYISGAIMIITLVNLGVRTLKQQVLFLGRISYMMFLINGEIILHIGKYFRGFGEGILQKIACLVTIIMFGYILDQLFYNTCARRLADGDGQHRSEYINGTGVGE